MSLFFEPYRFGKKKKGYLTSYDAKIMKRLCFLLSTVAIEYWLKGW